MKIKRIMIAAPRSGSGKTTVTCALLQALKNRGKQVAACKCGPDYIDPMFHEQVLGVPSCNLDTFFTEKDRTRMLFMRHVAEGGLREEYAHAVVEGVMGLYDGLGGIREEGSSYHLAEVTGTPIVFVADVKGMGRSIVAYLAGFLQYDRSRLIRGVILNRISVGYYETVKPMVEKELGLRVLGFLPERESFHMESRHLGLIMPGELEGIRERLRSVAMEFERTVSVSGMLEIAESAGEMEERPEFCGLKVTAENRGIEEYAVAGKDGSRDKRPVIAVARDEAFCFYYKDNLRMLRENGAEIRYFSPIHDQRLPEECAGILLGGGYPELHAEKLSRNVSMLAAVRKAAEEKMPIVAECGGFLYLHRGLTDREGVRHVMAGVLAAECFYTGKSVRFGYVELQEKKSSFLPEGEKIKGHEFHYYDSFAPGEDVLAVKPATGKRYFCVTEGENCWMGFPHLYYPSNPAFAGSFVGKAREYRERMDMPVRIT